MRDEKGKFLKGHISAKPFKKKICQKCHKEFETRLYTQKYCGSSIVKNTCSYINRMDNKDRYGGMKQKICVACDKKFLTTSNNQKFCGGKYIANTCSWRNQMKKQQKFTWLSGLKITI